MSADSATPPDAPGPPAQVRRTVVLDLPSPGQARDAGGPGAEAERAWAAVGRAREAVVAAARGTRLTPGAAEGLVLAVSEVVTNALRHGAPPVCVVILARPDLVEVVVSDAGPGPDHLDIAAASSDTPPVATDATGGRGLWLAHRNCDEVEVTAGEAGCTVRLVARTSP